MSIGMSVNHVRDGFYEWQPKDECKVDWLDMGQIVQVIEGMVWATGVTAEVSAAEADKHGFFIRKIGFWGKE